MKPGSDGSLTLIITFDIFHKSVCVVLHNIIHPSLGRGLCCFLYIVHDLFAQKISTSISTVSRLSDQYKSQCGDLCVMFLDFLERTKLQSVSCQALTKS